MTASETDLQYHYECFFCGCIGHPMVESEKFEQERVRAHDETPLEAQDRMVCADCHPRREDIDDGD